MNFNIKTLGPQNGSFFNDTITIDLNPCDIVEIAETYRKKAMDTSSYLEQGIFRKLADFFQKADQEWEKQRREKDKEEKE